MGLDFVQMCDAARPEEVINEQLHVLEQASNVLAAIKRCCSFAIRDDDRKVYNDLRSRQQGMVESIGSAAFVQHAQALKCIRITEA